MRITATLTAALIGASFTASAFATLPPPTPEGKAQAAAVAAKSAWTEKVSSYQTCLAGNRTAERYRSSLKAAMKDVPPAMATPPCVDPGPFVAEAKPLEAAGAHSPPETAKGPPSGTATAAELAGGVKK
jgi:hypothetical protein